MPGGLNNLDQMNLGGQQPGGNRPSWAKEESKQPARSNSPFNKAPPSPKGMGGMMGGTPNPDFGDLLVGSNLKPVIQQTTPRVPSPRHAAPV